MYTRPFILCIVLRLTKYVCHQGAEQKEMKDLFLQYEAKTYVGGNEFRAALRAQMPLPKEMRVVFV